MSNISIFKNQSGESSGRRPLSDLAKSVGVKTTSRRIQTNTNGTFRKVINGEQIGKAIRGEFNAIIVAMLQKVSRTFYAGTYDPNVKATLPDCWSNNGDRPEEKSANPQSASCATCKQNIEGSGDNGKSKACRFQRRIALLLEGDASGDVYQFNVPAKSLFGKGTGNVHPYESYIKYLSANDISPDYVVTNISYNLDASTMALQFMPSREITDDEYALVAAAQSRPETKRLVQLTVGEVDGAKPRAEASASVFQARPQALPQTGMVDYAEIDDEEETPPTKRASTKKEEPSAPNAPSDLAAIMDAWGSEEDDD